MNYFIPSSYNFESPCFFCEKQKARFLQVKPQYNEPLYDDVTYNFCSAPVQKIHVTSVAQARKDLSKIQEEQCSPLSRKQQALQHRSKVSPNHILLVAFLRIHNITMARSKERKLCGKSLRAFLILNYSFQSLWRW